MRGHLLRGPFVPDLCQDPRLQRPSCKGPPFQGPLPCITRHPSPLPGKTLRRNAAPSLVLGCVAVLSSVRRSRRHSETLPVRELLSGFRASQSTADAESNSTQLSEKAMVKACMDLLPQDGTEMYMSAMGFALGKTPTMQAIKTRYGWLRYFLAKHSDAFAIREDSRGFLVSALSSAPQDAQAVKAALPDGGSTLHMNQEPQSASDAKSDSTQLSEKAMVRACVDLLPEDGTEIYMSSLGLALGRTPAMRAIKARFPKLRTFLAKHNDIFVIRQDDVDYFVSAVSCASQDLVQAVKDVLPDDGSTRYMAVVGEKLPARAKDAILKRYGRLKKFFKQHPSDFVLEHRPPSSTSVGIKHSGTDFERQPIEEPSPLESLFDAPVPEPVAVVVEGQLRRTGHISRVLLNIATRDEPLVFDVLEGEMEDIDYMQTSMLKRLLESKDIIKIMHDCASVSETLQLVHGVRLAQVVDTQALWNAVHTSDIADPAIGEMLKELCGEMPSSSSRWKSRLAAERLQELMEIQAHQVTWDMRPLPDELDQQSRWHVQNLRGACGALMQKLPREAFREVRGEFARRLDELRDRTSSGVDSLEPGERAEFQILNGQLELLDEDMQGADLHQDVHLEDTDSALEESAFLNVLPDDVCRAVKSSPGFETIVELVLDTGRFPIIRHQQKRDTNAAEEKGLDARNDYVDEPLEDLDRVDAELLNRVADTLRGFNEQHRAIVPASLHRSSGLFDSSGDLAGITLRYARHMPGCMAPLADLLHGSILFVGGPGVGKTTLLRECASQISRQRRVMIVDGSNEIAGDSATVHGSVGSARRVMIQGSGSDGQKAAMLEALQNHTPQVIVVDEISDPAEAQAARTITRRGVMLVATCHGRSLRDLRQNQELSSLLGGFNTVILAANEQRYNGIRKTAIERIAPPLFDSIVEVKSRDSWVVHRNPAQAIDDILDGRRPKAEHRWRQADGSFWVEMVAA